MNKKKCPECSLVNWSEAEFCARCRSSFDTPSHYDKSGSKQFDAVAKTLKTQPTWLVGTLILVIAAIGLFTVYRVTNTTPAKASSNSSTNSQTQPQQLGPEKDFAHWNAGWPDFNKIVEDERRAWEAKMGANDVINPGGMIGPRIGQFSNQPGYVPPTYGKHCPGKVENAVLKSYRIFKVEDELLMMVEIEADPYLANVTADKQCGTLITYHRSSVEVPYVWKWLGSYGEWQKRVSGEPFGGAKTVEKERLKKLDEYNKFEADLKEKERKRAERRRQQAANQSSSF